jgi:hypothetical protein
LRDDLVPFLTARSGQALDEFARWAAASQRPLDWKLNMLEYLPMSMPTRQELLATFPQVDDPEIQERRRQIVNALLDVTPPMRQQIQHEGRLEGQREGRLEGQRASLRRVFSSRQLAVSPDDDARIEACADTTVLDRWLDRALTAVTVAEALT